MFSGSHLLNNIGAELLTKRILTTRTGQWKVNSNLLKGTRPVKCKTYLLQILTLVMCLARKDLIQKTFSFFFLFFSSLIQSGVEGCHPSTGDVVTAHLLQSALSHPIIIKYAEYGILAFYKNGNSSIQENSNSKISK